MALVLMRGLVAMEGQQNSVLYCCIDIIAVNKIGIVGKPNILVSLIH